MILSERTSKRQPTLDQNDDQATVSCFNGHMNALFAKISKMGHCVAMSK